MIKELIKLANHLDRKGLRKEADYLDAAIRKMADGSIEAWLERGIDYPGDIGNTMGSEGEIGDVLLEGAESEDEVIDEPNPNDFVEEEPLLEEEWMLEEL